MRHPTLRLATYALPSLVSSVAALPLVRFVPAFYSDDLDMPLAAVGVALAASRLLDVVTDPLIGIASDRFGLGWGRRKPWIALGTPLFCGSSSCRAGRPARAACSAGRRFSTSASR